MPWENSEPRVQSFIISKVISQPLRIYERQYYTFLLNLCFLPKKIPQVSFIADREAGSLEEWCRWMASGQSVVVAFVNGLKLWCFRNVCCCPHVHHEPRDNHFILPGRQSWILITKKWSSGDAQFLKGVLQNEIILEVWKGKCHGKSFSYSNWWYFWAIATMRFCWVGLFQSDL